jgi:hypothetical protein
MSNVHSDLSGFSIGAPFDVQHRIHVDFDYKWTGEEPSSAFTLNEMIGEGYHYLLHLTKFTTSTVLLVQCIR